jgi:O-acetyl-ADP-ribose deacetylase (regulator of RNase III)
MIEIKNGNILVADAEALVNTVNCVGIMGRGIALQFKDAFPENFKAYQRACKNEEVQPGKMLVHELNRLTNPRFVINFPTKRHWKGKSRMEDIEAGLIDLRETIERLGIKSIAIPPLGSGLGGLNWQEVRPRIEEMVSHLPDVQVLIYEPLTDKIEKSKTVDRNPPNMTVSRALLVLLMDKYRRAILDPYVSLLEVHKLLYLLQEAGQELKLKFAKAPFGPFAENVRHVLLAVEGYYVVGYDGGADSPQKRLDIVPGAVEEAQTKVADEKDVLARLHRVFDLVEGWETPHGLELLATVHWVASQEGANNSEDVLARTYAWNTRKKKFTPRQIELAYSSLKAHGWLE